MPKISIIVPIYNVEKYLHQCLNSLLIQTLGDIEIILVDDGSKDSCPQIIDEYASKDSRIIAIHKQNEGYGHSCNTGLTRATGEYVAILEPDDYIESKMYEDLYNIAKDFDSDIVKSCFYDYLDTSKETKIEKVKFDNDKIPQNRSFNIQECPIFLFYHPSIWSCIYKRDFLVNNNIRFIEAPGAGWTDNPFQVQTMCLAKKINYTPNAYYYWRRLNNNHSEDLKDWTLPFKRSTEIHDWLEKNRIYDEDILACLYKRELVYLFIVLGKNKIPKQECFEYIRQICERMNARIIKEHKLIKKRERKLYNYCITNPHKARIYVRLKIFRKKFLSFKNIKKIYKR